MYCKECGTKNEKDAKFCSNCGKKITEASKKSEEKVNSSVNSNSTQDAGGIRKAIKKDAKGRINGHLIGATAIYMVVCAIINGIFSHTTTTYNGVGAHVSVNTTSALPSILTMILGIIFTLGLLIVGFKAIKGEKFEFSEVFLKPFENMKFFGYALLLTIIVAAATIVLAIIPIVGWIALIVGYIYYAPAFTTFLISLADPKTDKEISFTDLAKKSLDIVKGNRMEYYGVTFSFIGWMLLAIITCGILFIWLTPYMEITYINLYEKWIKAKNFTATETGLSNGAVVGITAGGAGCGCLVAIVIVIATIGIFAGVIKDNINDPQIKSFIDKYLNSNNITENNSNNNYGNYRSYYNN